MSVFPHEREFWLDLILLAMIASGTEGLLRFGVKTFTLVRYVMRA